MNESDLFRSQEAKEFWNEVWPLLWEVDVANDPQAQAHLDSGEDKNEVRRGFVRTEPLEGRQ